MGTQAVTIAKSIARHVLTVERALMGLVFFGLGLSGLLNLLPSTPDGAVALGGALVKAGYLFPLLKGAEVLLELAANGACKKA